jgi:hypothetical protein
MLKLYSIKNSDDERKRVFYQPGTNEFDALGGFLDRWENAIYKLEIFEFAEDNKKRLRKLGRIWKEMRGLDTRKFVAKEIKIEGYHISLFKLEGLLK